MEKTNSVSYKKTLLAGIISENPVFVSLLGMCSALATTKTIEAAIGMGILVILVLIGSNVLVSLLRKIIPAEAKIPCYIVIIATFVTIVRMATKAFVPALDAGLGVFIPLIVVNCIILGRAESFASKNGVLASLVDAIGCGLGYTLAIVVIAVFREIIGTGAITIGVAFPIGKTIVFRLFPEAYAISLFVQPAGGFLVLAFILAFMAWRKNVKEEKAKAAEKARIEELKAKKAAELAAKKAAEEEAKKAEAAKAAEAPKVEEKPAEPVAEGKAPLAPKAEEKPAEPEKAPEAPKAEEAKEEAKAVAEAPVKEAE